MSLQNLVDDVQCVGKEMNNMIYENNVRRFCNGDISHIENYDKAITDMEHTWDCHHRLEIGQNGERISRDKLKVMDYTITDLLLNSYS